MRKKFDSQKSKVESSNFNIDSRPLFAGYKPGKAFFTKLGNRGMGIDTLWVRHLIESFTLDDDELAAIALNSSLADVTLQVTGGEFGSPYSIGDFGFYTNDLFDKQANLLSSHEKEITTGQFFLSVGEWKVVDTYLSRLAHHARALFDRVAVGDTIGSLAVKKNAFVVVKMCIERGLDPLVENSEQRDLFHSIKNQYLDVTKELKQIFVEETVFYRDIKIISDIDKMVYRQQRNRTSFDHLIILLEYLLNDTFPRRLVLIDQDMSFKRRCELLDKPFPPEKAWNISQLSKLRGHIEDCKELITYSKEKVIQCDKNMIEFQEKLTKFQQETKARQEAILNNVKYDEKDKTKEGKEKEGGKRKSTRKSRRHRESQSAPGAGVGDEGVEDSLALAVIDEHKEHREDKDKEKKSPLKQRRSVRSRERDRGGSMGSEDNSEEDHSMEEISEKSSSSSLIVGNGKETPVKNRQTLIGLLVVNTPDTKVYYK